MKLVKMEIDGRWKSADMNEVVLTIRDDNQVDIKMNLPYSKDLLDRIYDVVMPDITNMISDMFNSLTGSEQPMTPIDSDDPGILTEGKQNV